jgi:phosphodiesterase/alkaline phosphatase D-like protein
VAGSGSAVAVSPTGWSSFAVSEIELEAVVLSAGFVSGAGSSGSEVFWTAPAPSPAGSGAVSSGMAADANVSASLII